MPKYFNRSSPICQCRHHKGKKKWGQSELYRRISQTTFSISLPKLKTWKTWIMIIYSWELWLGFSTSLNKHHSLFHFRLPCIPIYLPLSLSLSHCLSLTHTHAHSHAHNRSHSIGNCAFITHLKAILS